MLGVAQFALANSSASLTCKGQLKFGLQTGFSSKCTHTSLLLADCRLIAPANIGWTVALQVWSLIDQKVGPWVRRVPMLQTALSYAQRWFLSVGRS